MKTETHAGNLPGNVTTFRRSFDLNKIKIKPPALSMRHSKITSLDEYRDRKSLNEAENGILDLTQRTYEVVRQKREGDSITNFEKTPDLCATCQLDTNLLYYFIDPKNSRIMYGGYCSRQCFESYLEYIDQHRAPEDEEPILHNNFLLSL
ncbi:MAG: hypothetical protein AABX03_00520 [Nanoarchaeota archaeon]